MDLRTSVTAEQFERCIEANKGNFATSDILRRLWAEIQQLRSNHAEAAFVQGLNEEFT